MEGGESFCQVFWVSLDSSTSFHLLGILDNCIPPYHLILWLALWKISPHTYFLRCITRMVHNSPELVASRLEWLSFQWTKIQSEFSVLFLEIINVKAAFLEQKVFLFIHSLSSFHLTHPAPFWTTLNPWILCGIYIFLAPAYNIREGGRIKLNFDLKDNILICPLCY